jgi:phage tail-like protein
MKVAPQRNRFVLLDGMASWRATTLERIEILEPENDLRLESIPGTLSTMLAEEDAGAIAVDGDRLFIANRKTGEIHLAGRGPLPGIGGKGRGARRITDPRGLALLSDDSIAVSDPANHRVQIFGPFPYPLLQVWTFKQPWGIAASDEGLYIADRGDACVHRYTRDGRDLGALRSPELHAPTEIARAGTLTAVIDGERVVLLDHEGASVIAVEHAASLAFDQEAGLYVGTSDGLLHKFLPDGSPRGYRPVGVAVSGLDGAIASLCSTDPELLAIVDGRVWRGDSSAAFVADGTYLTDIIDSGIESCEWHRVIIDGDIPAGTSVEVTAETSDRDDALANPTFSRQHSHLLGEATKDCLLLTKPGQYLRLRLRFRSAATASPRIHALRIEFPRESYLQYLPAVYQEDPVSREFLARFLSIFQTSFDSIDRRIDDLWLLFEPMAVPRQYLPWLAAWLALPLSPDWSEAKTREVLERAFADSLRRGTAAGLEQSIADYAGVEAHVVEHFKLRRWIRLGDGQMNCAGTGAGSRLWSRAFYDRMQLESWSRIGYFSLRGAPEPGVESADWGANEFSVFFVTDPYTIADDTKKVARIVERDKPAHTLASLCPVLPRLRIGVQATVGVDTVVGGISNLVLGRLSTLGYDSILACSSSEHSARASGGNVRPRAGLSTQLL